MERTESKVVQVAPNHENAKIKEMERFGWNLQNRQEIHEEGDVEISAATGLLDTADYKTKQTINKYVKLHFARSKELDNLDKIKELENEYHSFSSPKIPSLKWPIGLLILFIIGFIGSAGQMAGGELFFSILIGAGLGYWSYSRYQKKNDAYKEREKIKKSADQILSEVSELT